MAEDPRDPRNPRRSVQETLDHLASGFDAFLADERSVRGEYMATTKDLQRSLAMLSQVLSDASVVGSGSAGLGVPINTGKVASARQAVAVAQSQISGAVGGAAIRDTEADQRYRVMDYSLDPLSQKSLGAQTRSTLRERVATRVLMGTQDRVSQMYPEGGTEEWIEGPGGQMLNLAPGISITPAGRYRGAGGRFVSPSDAVVGSVSQDEHASMLRRAWMAGKVGQVAGAYRGGAPVGRALASALPSTALRAAGVAGAVVYGADRALDFVQDQAAINRELQGAYGGDLTDQWGDRVDRWWNRNITGRFSMLGSENYDRLFQGAMDLGLRGDERGNYIEEGAGIMRTGASADQTQRILKMAIDAGQGLDGLAEALRNVSNVARDAGKNASRAREVFIQNFQLGTEFMFSSPSSKQFAEYLTSAQMSMPRQFQDLAMTGTMTNLGVQGAIASRLGMPLFEYQAQTMQDPTLGMRNAEQYMREQLRGWQGGDGLTIPQIVERFMAENPDFDRSRDADLRALGQAIVAGGFPVQLLEMRWRSVGENFTGLDAAVQAGLLFVQGGTVGDRMLEAEQERIAGLRPQGVDSAWYTGNSNTGGITRMHPDAFIDPKNAFQGADLSSLGIDYAEANMGPISDREKLINAALEGISGGRGREGVLRGMLGKQWNPMLGEIADSASITNLGKAKVVVKTADGRKVVSLEEAMRDFQDQILSGEADLIGEGWEESVQGTDSATAFGIPRQVADAVDVTSTTRSIDYGQEYDDAMEEVKRQNADSGGASNVAVTIDMPEDLKRFLIASVDSQYMSPAAPGFGG